MFLFIHLCIVSNGNVGELLRGLIKSLYVYIKNLKIANNY